MLISFAYLAFSAVLRCRSAAAAASSPKTSSCSSCDISARTKPLARSCRRQRSQSGCEPAAPSGSMILAAAEIRGSGRVRRCWLRLSPVSGRSCTRPHPPCTRPHPPCTRPHPPTKLDSADQQFLRTGLVKRGAAASPSSDAASRAPAAGHEKAVSLGKSGASARKRATIPSSGIE